MGGENPEEAFQQGMTLNVPCGLTIDGLTPGSKLHGSGSCRPCAWFWKESGCQRGQACMYCHLCPEGELKARKKAKHAQMQSDHTGAPLRRVVAAPIAVAGVVGAALHQDKHPLGLANLL